MTIQQKYTLRNGVNNTLDEFLGAGNLIPHIWYHKILRAGGKPDTVGLTILSELVYFYRTSENGQREFQIGHAHFRNKFNFTNNQSYEALVRLEQQGLISRDERPVIMYGRKFGNELFITLKVENLIMLLSSGNSEKGKKKFTHNQNSSLLPIKEKSSFNIDKNKKKENKSRSSESNFGKIFFKEKDSIKVEADKNASLIALPIKPSISTPSINIQNLKKIEIKRRNDLAAFYPLTEKDGEILRQNSAREFSLHYMNQLLLKLSSLKPEHGFYSKETFIKYMTKVLSNELRDATKVSNEGFRFKQVKEGAIKEKYLEEIEYSSDTSKHTQFKRKIISIFDQDTAYNFLTNCTFNEGEVENKIFVIEIIKSFEISENQKVRLIDQVRSVFGNHIEELDIKRSSYSLNSKTESENKEFQLNLGNPGSIWNKISSKLANYYGAAMHYSWFSKLEAEEDDKGRRLILKAPTNFIRDWIDTNYKVVLEQCCEVEQYKLAICT